ncbi:MAG: response regulator [Thermodesulfobacteriota bacterium]
MRKAIDRLIDIEDKASSVYSSAARFFKGDDEELFEFLVRLEFEEKQHQAALRRAAELVEEDSAPALSRYNHPDLPDHLIERFQSVECEIEANTLTRERLMECIVRTEFSEWNDLFMYVMTALKRRFSQFIPVAVEIEKHRRLIQRFLERRPEFSESLEVLKSLPCLWKEKILVVDDEEMITDLFRAILSGEGSVECASNGEEAFQRLEQSYYAAVVSDVDMPVMNGMELYRKAVERYPGIGSRFIFFTGRILPETAAFFEENNLRFLRKPASITEIKRAIIDILN